MVKKILKKTRAVDVVRTCKSLVYLNKLKDKKVDGKRKIRVVFLFQMPELWNKIESIFQKMLKDDNFEVIILAIPKQKIGAVDEENDYLENDALKYSKNFKCKVVDGRKDNKWTSLKDLNPDYVFYQRPYDNYLPTEYRSKNVIKYTKTCYVSYGFEFTHLEEDIMFDRNFFRNIYMFFAENEEIKNLVVRRDILSYKMDRLKVLNLGYPPFEKVLEFKNDLKDNWIRARKKDKLRIMWTPRWTTDATLFATNFFNYKEDFLKLMNEDEKNYLLIRMHPLAFDNFLRSGDITEEELKELKKRIEKLSNVNLDKNKEYIDSFWNSDVLVADMSSVVIEYFLTGKPVIYCDTDINRLNQFGKRISEGFYLANNFEEVKRFLKDIEKGKDPLKEKRQDLIKELFGEEIESISKNIVKEIYLDSKTGED